MTQSERSLFGVVLLNGTIPDIRMEHFAEADSRKLWSAIETCIERDLSVNIANVVTVDGSLNPADVAGLTSDALPVSDLGYYVSEIKKVFRSREFARIGRELTERARDPDEAGAWLEDELSKVTGLSSDVRHVTLHKAMREALAIAETRYHSTRELPGITTGMRHIDGLTLGLEKGELWLVGARPAVGKSALLINMALNAAAKKARVGYAILEDSASALGRRALSTKSGVNAMKIATGNLSDADFLKMTVGAGELAGAKFEVLEGYAGLHISKLLTAARSLKRSHRIDILYVDYLQLLTGPGDRKHERIAACTEALKALAMQLEIPVCAAAQLTRDSEGRKPTLADFAESSELEKAANVALLLHKLEGETDTARELMIYAEKVRDGQTGYVKTVFHKEYLRIREEAA